MSEEILSGRVETVNFALLQASGEEVLTSPVYRLVVDVAGGSSVGRFQNGYYIRFNDSIYFVAKQTINVSRPDEAEKVFAFLAKTKQLFTISVKHSETLSGHQYVTGDVTDETEFYTIREFRVYHGLWRIIEGELYENLYSPSLARFTSEKLDWYVKLVPEHPLQFTQVTTISLSPVATQGHLQVFRIIKEDEHFAFPGYLYSVRKKFTFFNHEINETVDVIPLGSERRIISLSKEVQITSEDHDDNSTTRSISTLPPASTA